MFRKRTESIKYKKGKAVTNLNDYDRRFTEPYGEAGHDGENNGNLNVLVLGGRGNASRFVGPDLLQANCSYVVSDPGGEIYRKYGRHLECQGYKVRCLNLEHMDKGCRYNPFRYIHGDKDIAVLVNALIANTTPPEASGGDTFWEKAETAGFLTALVAFLHKYCSRDQQNFTSVMVLLQAALDSEDGNTRCSQLDAIFEEIRTLDPKSFAVRQYDDFRMSADKTLQSILVSCAARLHALDLLDVAELTKTDGIGLDAIGDEKTALFIITPTWDDTFNFLAATAYTQFIQEVYSYVENTACYSQLVVDGEGKVIRTFRAGSEDEALAQAEEAGRWLEKAKNAKVVCQKDRKLYALVTEDGGMVAFRGSKKDAQKALDLLQGGCVISNAQRSNYGHRLPIHVRVLMDGAAGTVRIPKFENMVATGRKYELSFAIALQTMAQLKKPYRRGWADIAGNCDTILVLDGGMDQETVDWLCSRIDGKPVIDLVHPDEGKRGFFRLFRKRRSGDILSPDRIRSLPEDECIVIARDCAFRDYKYRAGR